MNKKIAVLPGDGIGPEVMEASLFVLDAVAARYGHSFEICQALIGGTAYDNCGEHFPRATKDICDHSDAILFGSVGGPVSEMQLEKWKNCEVNSILGLRKAFNFNANFRPIKIFPELADCCPLRSELVSDGVDILFVRELVGDIYFGEKGRKETDGEKSAFDVASYTESQVRSVAKVGFEAALKRSKRLVSVDKANVLETSRFWREIIHEVGEDYAQVELSDMLVDNCAMQLITNPSQFDVILTTNMFGDILSDAGAVLPGSLGLLASASMNAAGFGMFEPPGGSAPELAGKGVANPIGQILSIAMMLRHSFGMNEEAERISQAVGAALRAGARTADIARSGDALPTKAMAEKIAGCIGEN